MKKQGVYIALFFAIIVAITFTLASWARVVDTNSQMEVRYKLAQETEWLYLKAIIAENYSKAKISAEFVKHKIVVGIDKEYKGDLVRLQYDLDNPSIDKPLYKIIQESITGVYINKPSDANDPVVFTKHGIVGDLSIDCSPNAKEVPFRSWVDEYKQQANPGLAMAAVKAILLHSKHPIFWEYSKSDNPNHKIIHYMALSELEKIYYAEGINGLATYEFISYAMIFEDVDIAQRARNTGLGIANPESTIIYVTQGFNLLEALEVVHDNQLLNNKERFKLIREQSEKDIRDEIRMYIGLMVVLGTIVLTTLASYILRDSG